jgi:hypothetical protein
LTTAAPDSASTSKVRVDPRDVSRHLDKVLASSTFAGSSRVQQFLRFVVEETLNGRAGEIKESVVAIHVFGRKGDFDSQSDSVVRVHATHLRKRLRDYYRVEGLQDGVVIELLPGSYVPAFRAAANGHPTVAGPRRRVLTVAILTTLAAATVLAAFG